MASQNDTEGFYTAMGEAVNGPGGYFGRRLDSLRDFCSEASGRPETILGDARKFRSAFGLPV